MTSSEVRGNREQVTGVVTSNAMDKTITVRSERVRQHPKYLRFVRKATIYKAHDEANEARVGDTVEIVSCRPRSKTKAWRLLRVVEKGSES